MNFLGTQEEAAEAYDIAAIKFRGLNAVTNFDMSRYDVNSILESSTLPIGGAAKRLKDAEQAEMTIDSHRTDNENISSQLTDGISSYGTSHYPWPTVAFQQPHHNHHQPFSMHYPYGQRLWCKQEQDTEPNNQSFQDIHQLQLGNTHNFFQPSILHNLMSMDSSSMEHSSGSNSVVYSSGGADGNNGVNGSYHGMGSRAIPMATTVVANDDGEQNQGNGYEDGEVKVVGYENMLGSSDPFHGRSLYYLSQQSAAEGGGVVKGIISAYDDEGSACNNWVPTAVPTVGTRSSNMAVCHGASTFAVWNHT